MANTRMRHGTHRPGQCCRACHQTTAADYPHVNGLIEPAPTNAYADMDTEPKPFVGHDYPIVHIREDPGPQRSLAAKLFTSRMAGDPF